jgi:hypothetical protein
MWPHLCNEARVEIYQKWEFVGVALQIDLPLGDNLCSVLFA